jgi:hypothetical protein
MLETALVALASAGGTALVNAIVPDAWKLAKSGFSRLLGRQNPARIQIIEARIDQTRSALESAGDQVDKVKEEHQIAWSTRLGDALAENPSIADEFRDLVGRIDAINSRSLGSVSQESVAYDNAQQAVLGHGYQVNNFSSQGTGNGN